MKKTLIATLAALALPAFAGDRSAKDEVLDALESQAIAPVRRPTLPDQASDRAREVHETIAFGQNGAAQKAAHAAAGSNAANAAKDAAAKAAERAARHSDNAANASRAEERRNGMGPSKPKRVK